MVKSFINILFLLALICSPQWVFSGGFQPTVFGARQLGMANAGSATLHGASSMVFNPGAIGFIENKFNFQLATVGIWESSVFYDPTSGITARTVDKVRFNLTGALTYKLLPGLTVGFSIYQPYKVYTQWENSWKGRFVSNQFKFEVTNYQPTLAIRLSKGISFGAGLVYSVANFSTAKDIPLNSVTGSTSTMQLNGVGNTLTGNFGVLWKVSEKINGAFTFMSGARYRIKDGGVKTSVPADLSDEFPAENTFKTVLTSPDKYAVGFTYLLTERFTVAGELSLKQWGDVKDISIDIAKNSPTLKDINLTRKLQNTKSVSVGFQYLRNCCLTYRGGVSFEESPVNSRYFYPDNVDAGKLNFHAGIGYDFNDHWSVDAAAVFSEGYQIDGSYHPISFRGYYKTRAIGGVVGLTFVF